MDSGVPGVSVQPGDHICALYVGDADHPQCVLCMYDLSRFGGGIVMDVR
jgi:hypothetical protein